MVGIVILNYKTWHETLKCVESIKKTDKLPSKIYIVDNCSPNDSYVELSHYYRDDNMIDVILANGNLGFAKGNNLGIDACIRDGIRYAVVTNNDIVFNEGSLSSMYNFISNNDGTVIVGPKILDIHGNILSSSLLGEQNLLQYLNILSRNRLFLDEANAKEARQVFSVSGCCFIIDIEKFKSMGAFDEGTFLYHEEGILSAQVKRSDLNMFFLPSASVIHNHGATTGINNIFIEEEMLKSGLYYWRKYRELNILQLVFVWIVFVAHTMIKSIFCKNLQKGRIKYLIETWDALWKIAYKM